MGGDVNGKFRKLIFWLHLLAGLIAGVVILIMCVTGAALAFEKEIVAWAERDVRRVVPPAAATARLPLDKLLAKVKEMKPGERPSGITLDTDPNIALLVSFGRTNAFYVNPYSGEVREQGAPGVRAFMHVMIDWHRYLGGHDEKRALGKAITGACNVAFLFLGVSGLYLWWPRQWTRNAFRAVGLMNFKLSGKARDWNWHNAVGFWTAPVLIVLTATAMPISYQWAGNLIYKLTGTTPPPQGSGLGGASGAAVEVPTPPAGAKPLGMAELFAVAQQEFPQWQQISQRASGPGGRGQRSVAAGVPPAVEPGFQPGGKNAEISKRDKNSGRVKSPDAKPDGRMPSSTAGGTPATTTERRSPLPVTLTITEKANWPPFANTQLTLDPFTGAVLRKEGFGDYNLGWQVRSWTRFLHTGEALGMLGKAVAGLASAGAALLVWTGFALAWRRFFPRQGDGDAPSPPG